MQTKTGKQKRRMTGFQVVENECIWMKAGVVNFRLCDNVYDCYNCPFDKSMRIAMSKKYTGNKDEKKVDISIELQKRHFGGNLPCRHTLTGRIDAPKICTQNYECHHCAYDQWLDEYDVSEPVRRLNYKLASGYRVASGYYYHDGHGWACFEHGGRVRVGFDDFLVRLFGVMDTIDLPPLGRRLKQGREGWTFNRDGNEAVVLSPVSGTVLAVNHKALDHPSIAHADPYQEGWLCILESDLPVKDGRKLYFGTESIQWMETESSKLLNLMGPEYEELAALGGEPIGDVYGNFPELGWDRLARTFLKT